jgi:hypothetical protein
MIKLEVGCFLFLIVFSSCSRDVPNNPLEINYLEKCAYCFPKVIVTEAKDTLFEVQVYSATVALSNNNLCTTEVNGKQVKIYPVFKINGIVLDDLENGYIGKFSFISKFNGEMSKDIETQTWEGEVIVPLWLVFRHQPSFSLLRQDIYDHWIGAAGALEVGRLRIPTNSLGSTYFTLLAQVCDLSHYLSYSKG